MKFRKDINGLRAFAVVAVILFHFGISWIPGGFVGVDVFFVISGFLMTAIIFRGLDKNTFSFANFYAARARRIVPALAFVCAAMLVFGWFYLIPSDYALLGRHVASSMAFISNFTYNNEAGYFDVDSHHKWLLHTWSLSAEWQFYLIYPVVLAVLHRFFSMKVLRVIILILTVLGYLYGIYATQQDPDAAYYLLSSRGWVMLAGGLIYLYPLSLSENNKKFAEWAGLALIIGSYILIDSNIFHWPGAIAILPIIGTMLMVYAHRDDSIFTANVVAQKLGTWSYSIYLWHWPIVVGIRYFELPNYWLYIGMGLSILMGYLSYRYVETANWKSSYHGLKRLLTFKPLYMMIVLAIIGRAAHKTEGFISHYPEPVIIVSQEAQNRNPYRCIEGEKFPCYIGNQDNVKVIVAGDSHAEAMTTAVSEHFDLEKEGVVALNKSACPLVSGIEDVSSDKTNCLKTNKERLTLLTKQYPNTPLVWMARSGLYLYGDNSFDRDDPLHDPIPMGYFTKQYKAPSPELDREFETHLDQTIAALARDRQIYMVLPVPELLHDVPRTLSKDLLIYKEIRHDLSLPKIEYFARTAAVRDMIMRVANKHDAVVLDPVPYLCPEDKCMVQYQNRPLYFDDDHLSQSSKPFITPMFNPVAIK